MQSRFSLKRVGVGCDGTGFFLFSLVISREPGAEYTGFVAMRGKVNSKLLLDVGAEWESLVKRWKNLYPASGGRGTSLVGKARFLSFYFPSPLNFLFLVPHAIPTPPGRAKYTPSTNIGDDSASRLAAVYTWTDH